MIPLLFLCSSQKHVIKGAHDYLEKYKAKQICVQITFLKDFTFVGGFM